MYITKNKIIFCFIILKYNSLFQFKSLVDLTSLDFLSKKHRFFFKYFLLSYRYNLRIVITIKVHELSTVISLKSFFFSAGHLEREVWDLFGIYFLGNWSLRRILTDYGFTGKPLRKDFPLTGFLEIIYDDSNKCLKLESIQLLQKYRNYNFFNPWQKL